MIIIAHLAISVQQPNNYQNLRSSDIDVESVPQKRHVFVASKLVNGSQNIQLLYSTIPIAVSAMSTEMQGTSHTVTATIL